MILGMSLSFSTWILSCTVHWVGKEKPSLLPHPHRVQGHSVRGRMHKTLQASDTRARQPTRAGSSTSAGAPAEVGGRTSSCRLRPGSLPTPLKLSFHLIWGSLYTVYRFKVFALSQRTSRRGKGSEKLLMLLRGEKSEESPRGGMTAVR